MNLNEATNLPSVIKADCDTCGGNGTLISTQPRFDSGFGNWVPKDTEYTCDTCNGTTVVEIDTLTEDGAEVLNQLAEAAWEYLRLDEGETTEDFEQACEQAETHYLGVLHRLHLNSTEALAWYALETKRKNGQLPPAPADLSDLKDTNPLPF
jgi:hypothetical protein